MKKSTAQLVGETCSALFKTLPTVRDALKSIQRLKSNNKNRNGKIQ